jgi:hypothetical protein
MAVPVNTKPSFSPGLPHPFAEGEYVVSVHDYDVLPGDKQFLFIQENEQTATQIHVVLNWFDELKRLMAAQKQ